MTLTGLLLCAPPGTDQAAWGEREVDISNEVAQALSLMEPPVTAPRKRVEQAIVSARGNIEEAKQVRSSFIWGLVDAGFRSSNSGGSFPPNGGAHQLLGLGLQQWRLWWLHVQTTKLRCCAVCRSCIARRHRALPRRRCPVPRPALLQ